MRTGRPWLPSLVTLFVGAVAILLVVFGRLGDGSFDCPGNALELSRHPLPEDNWPVDGFYAAPACNRAAQDRMQARPWAFGGAGAAVAASGLLTVGLMHRQSRM